MRYNKHKCAATLEFNMALLIPCFSILCYRILSIKIVSEYDQDIPQSQTADKPMAPRGRARQQTKQSNQLSLPHQDDCKTRRDIK